MYTEQQQQQQQPKQLRHICLFLSLEAVHRRRSHLARNRSIYVMRIVNNVTGIEIYEPGMPYGGPLVLLLLLLSLTEQP